MVTKTKAAKAAEIRDLGALLQPAFWSRTSEIPAPIRMDTAADIAQAQLMRTAMDVSGGQLVCNPIPADDEISAEVLSPIISQALTEAKVQGISAKDVTPFLLGRIFELTNGRSLDANIALVRNNARLAAEISIKMQNLVKT